MKAFKKWISINRWQITLLIFLVFVVYFNSLGNDFISDDLAATINSPTINSYKYIIKPPYFGLDLQSVIYFIINKIFGLHPIIFRLVNLCFHMSSACLIYYLLGRFFAKPIPLTSASIFAVHPLLTESVVWISGSHYLIYGFFLLASFAAYLKAKENPAIKKYCWLSMIYFYLSLSVSEKAVVYPFILFTYEFTFQRLRKHWKDLVPFFCLSFFWTLFFIVSGRISYRFSTLSNQYYQVITLQNPLIQIPIAISSYLQLIFWPNLLTLYHSEMSFTTVQFIFHLVIFLGYISLTVFYYFKNRKIFFWLALFFIGLTPTLTPFGVSWIVAERYVYFSAIGVFVVLGIFFNWLIQKNKELGWIIVVFVVLSLSIRTIVRNADWKNQDTLWLAMARTSPSSPQNHNNLGDYYGRNGNLNKAIEEFKIAIELNPRYADAYHNLGNTYQQMGKNDLALESFEKAISINSNLWQSYANIGVIYYQQKDYQNAKEYLKKAIEITPNNENILTGLGFVYLEQGLKEKAIDAFNKALEINPNYQLARDGIVRLKNLEKLK